MSRNLGPMAVSFWRFLTGAALLLAARAVGPARVLLLYVATVIAALAYPLCFAGTAAVRAAASSAVMLTALAGLAAAESRRE